MNLALISDTHGNFIALNAVLEQLRREPIDQIVFLLMCERRNIPLTTF